MTDPRIQLSLQSVAARIWRLECLRQTAIAWGLLSALGFHFVAGIKHLLMDTGYGVDLEGGNRKAQITVVISAVLVVLAGVWVW